MKITTNNCLTLTKTLKESKENSDHIVSCSKDFLKLCAEVIEQLVKEHDAAIADLHKVADCRTCGNLTSFCSENPDHCKGYVWRGVQEVQNNG